MENIQSFETAELNAEELEKIAGGKSGSKLVKTTGNVNVRKGPGKDYAVMGVLSEGITVSYLGTTKKDGRGVAWYKINYNGNVGWVSSKYSKLV